MAQIEILRIDDLSIPFKTKAEFYSVINQPNFGLYRNEVLGFVGESGSGKSVTALAILGLLPKNIS